MVLSLREHLAVSGDIFGCHKLCVYGVLLMGSSWQVEVRRGVTHSTMHKTSHRHKKLPSPKCAKLRNPDLGVIWCETNM